MAETSEKHQASATDIHLKSHYSCWYLAATGELTHIEPYITGGFPRRSKKGLTGYQVNENQHGTGCLV